MQGRLLPPRRSILAWHPAHDLVEREPGHWELFERVDSVNPRPPSKYADIQLVKRSDGKKLYRCIALLRPTPNPVDLGRCSTLWDAAMLCHQRYVDNARGIPPHDGYPNWREGRQLPNVPDRTERD